MCELLIGIVLILCLFYIFYINKIRNYNENFYLKKYQKSINSYLMGKDFWYPYYDPAYPYLYYYNFV